MSKEQKGKNAVLVIAVGKHPKMGPGKRDYKNDKSMKKAFNILKQKKTQAERKKAYEERQARREQREKEMNAYNAGTASEEVKQKIEQSRANTESGANQNLRFADKNKGGSQQKRMPKKAKPFDTSVFDRWVEKNSLTDKDTNRISSENAMQLAHRTGIKINDIQNKNFDKYDIGALKQALEAMGKENYEKRQQARLDRQDRRTTGVGRNENDNDTPQQGVNYDDLDAEDFNDGTRREGKEEGPNLGATGRHLDAIKRIAMARGLSVQQVESMMDSDSEREGYGGGGLNARGDERTYANDGDEDRELRNAPGGDMWSTPYATPKGQGFKAETERNPSGVGRSTGSQFKTNTTVEDTMHGFKPPINFDFGRVGDNPLEDEEVNMDEVQDMMNQKAEPMELAFRLLKNITKGGDCCKEDMCKDGSMCGGESKEKTFLRQCRQCGGMAGPSGKCACDTR